MLKAWFCIVLVLWSGFAGALSGALEQQAKAFYEAWLGTPYKHGGLSREGVDASGFVHLAAMELFQVRLPRNMADQIRVGEAVERTDLHAGDLVHFRNPRFVGIYLGEGRFAHVSSRRGVMAASLKGGYWGPKYAGARRLSGLPRVSSAAGGVANPGLAGMASYYGPEMTGRLTASGVPHDPEALTAAHPVLPFGSRLRVTRIASGRQVVVTVNDRGPFAENRVLDLSRAAAKALGGLADGVFEVRAEVVE